MKNIKSEYYTTLDETVAKFNIDPNGTDDIGEVVQKAEDEFLLFTLKLL